MAKTADQYPITTSYGCIRGYPLNPCKPGYGLHRGQDRAMPIGTEVKVNGRSIGKSGNTGASTGPHLHTGRFINGQHTNPGGGGFNISGAVVRDTGYNATNGNYVRVNDADGSYWVFLHLSEILCKAGDKLEGSMSTIATKQIVDSLAHAYLDDSVDNNPGLNFYIGQPVENVIQAFNNSAQRDKFLKEIAALRKGDAQVRLEKVKAIVN